MAQGRFLHLIVYIVENARLCYTLSVTAPILATGRGGSVNILLSFAISVLASVIAYYLCKWLDGE